MHADVVDLVNFWCRSRKHKLSSAVTLHSRSSKNGKWKLCEDEEARNIIWCFLFVFDTIKINVCIEKQRSPSRSVK